jgi:hypothetical protein
MNEKFVKVMIEALNAGPHERDSNMRTYDESVKYLIQKVRYMQEKIESHHENNELMMKERLIYEERM